jgi:tetratricopeptide (TPR) repeat protein
MGLIYVFYCDAKKFENNIDVSAKKIKITRFLASITLICYLVPSSRAILADIELRNIMNEKYRDGSQILEKLNQWPNSVPLEDIIYKYGTNLDNCPFVIRVADRLEEVDDRNSLAWFIKGICADKAGQQQQALEYVKQSLVFAPLNTQVLDVQYQLQKYLGYEQDALETKLKIKQIYDLK